MGLARFWPAMSGAEPWIGSKYAFPSPIFPDPPDSSAAEVRQDIAQEVFHHENIEVPGILDQTRRCRVGIAALGLDICVLPGHLKEDLPEVSKASKNIGFVNTGHSAAWRRRAPRCSP